MTECPNPAAALDDTHFTLPQKRAALENWLRKIRTGPDIGPDDQSDVAREITIALDAVDQLIDVDTSRGS